MSEIKQKNELIKSSRADFLFDLYSRGVELSQEDITFLKKANYIKEKKVKKPTKTKTTLVADPRIKSDKAIDADKHIDIIQGGKTEDGNIKISSAAGYQKITEGSEYRFEGSMEIEAEDWLPISRLEHEQEFVDWIDSMNTGFQTKTNFRKFNLYVQQATEWFAENTSMNDHHTVDDQKAYALEEMRKCKENTLYFLNKYLKLKEGDMSSGVMDYDAKPVHEAIAYLFDCGYSYMMGKPRQIAATSTLGGCALKKIIFNKNFFLKFITQDKETGIEIFDDKIKYPFGELPEWMKPTVSNDRDNLLKLTRKGTKKGTKKGMNSKLQVVAPSKTAINGGSPQLVMIDECGFISVLGKMMKEARPTMFMQDPVTKKLVMKRQIIAWGTAGDTDKGGKSYEEEYMDLMDKWANRNFSVGIIPIFFDWTTRPGITKEHYDSEKIVYTVEGPEKEEKMVQFRQAYPAILEDMFLTSAKTLVSIDYINTQLERIRSYPHTVRAQSGYFEPVFDTSVETGENDDVPFKIVGATFVPTEDGDPRASVKIFSHPKKNWINRYYSGVDPVMSDNGYSEMSASVIDVHLQTLSAILHYRDSNHKHTFLQTMLLGLYYNTSSKVKRIKELVESNIGTGYADYVELKGFYDSLVHRLELPPYMQGGSNPIGIDNRGARSKFIINKMFEFINAYGDRICIPIYFIQLRSFVCTITSSGNETWGTVDARKYHDDVLYSAVFAYICSLSYSHLVPKEIKTTDEQYTTRMELVRGPDGNLTRAEVRKKIR